MFPFLYLLYLILFSFAASMSISLVALNTRVTLKPDMAKRFWAAAEKNALATFNEPGCVQFVVGQKVEDAKEGDEDTNIFYFHDQFVNEKAYQAHHVSPHFQEFLTTVTPMIEKLENHKYLCRHEPQLRNPAVGTYCLNVESCVKPALFKEYHELMTSHATHSRAEPGCLQFDWGVKEEDGSFYMHEEYINKEAFQAHASSEHFARFVQFNKEKDPYTKAQDVGFFEVLGYGAK